MAKKTQRFTKKEIIITPFGVDINQFRPNLNKSKDGKFIFGTIKSLYPKYGIRYLIEAADILKDKINDFELWIAGKGSEEQYLKDLTKQLHLKDKIKFLGFLPHHKVPEILRKMDVFVVPSIWECESFGVAAVEAAASGLPVIASNLGGLSEVIVQNRTGFLVSPKSPKEIAEKIFFLYQNKKARQEMGKSARQFVIENYVWEDNAKIMLDAYYRFFQSIHS